MTKPLSYNKYIYTHPFNSLQELESKKPKSQTHTKIYLKASSSNSQIQCNINSHHISITQIPCSSGFKGLQTKEAREMNPEVKTAILQTQQSGNRKHAMCIAINVTDCKPFQVSSQLRSAKLLSLGKEMNEVALGDNSAYFKRANSNSYFSALCQSNDRKLVYHPSRHPKLPWSLDTYHPSHPVEGGICFYLYFCPYLSALPRYTYLLPPMQNHKYRNPSSVNSSLSRRNAISRLPYSLH